MRKILITILLLGCFEAITSAHSSLFEFHDSYGRCWRCLPGQACVRCNTALIPHVTGPPDTWDRTCAQPSADICNANLGVKFPHPDIGFYWICAEDNEIAVAPCFCDHVFDMREQQCVKIEDLRTIACDVYANSDPYDCSSEDVRPPPSTLAPNEPTTTDPGIPTAPNDPSDTTTPSVPTAPNDSTTDLITETTTTSVGPTITTESGGPGVTNPDETTTPAPCVCIVWWPCWCNPCWNMPCHSCNGCVGMVG